MTPRPNSELRWHIREKGMIYALRCRVGERLLRPHLLALLADYEDARMNAKFGGDNRRASDLSYVKLGLNRARGAALYGGTKWRRG